MKPDTLTRETPSDARRSARPHTAGPSPALRAARLRRSHRRRLRPPPPSRRTPCNSSSRGAGASCRLPPQLLCCRRVGRSVPIFIGLREAHAAIWRLSAFSPSAYAALYNNTVRVPRRAPAAPEARFMRPRKSPRAAPMAVRGVQHAAPFPRPGAVVRAQRRRSGGARAQRAAATAAPRPHLRHRRARGSQLPPAPRGSACGRGPLGAPRAAAATAAPFAPPSAAAAAT